MSESKLIETNKAIYHRYIQEVFNEGRLERLDELVSPEYILHDAPPGIPSGPEAIKNAVSMFRSGLPDFKITIEELVGEGDMLAARSISCGTHKGVLFGIAATGKVVNFGSLTMVRISNGRIRESWVKSDMAGLLDQLNS